MKLSPEAEARLADNRLKKLKNDADNKKLFWGFVILGCVIFATSFFAGARSTMLDGAHGPSIFYTAMAAGIFQILFGIGVVVMGFINYRLSEVGSACCIAVCVLLLIYYFLHLGDSIAVINIVLILMALGLCIRGQILTHRDQILKTEPGYPLFSPEASYASEYELPLNVKIAQQRATDQMGTVGLPAASAVPVTPEQATADAVQTLFGGKEVRLPDAVRLPEIRETDFGLEAELGRAHTPAPVPQITGDVTLEQFSQAADSAEKTGVEALPKVSAEDLLMDMTAVPSHAVKQGDASMLPDPAEVRARMAAMKKAREEHPRN